MSLIRTTHQKNLICTDYHETKKIMVWFGNEKRKSLITAFFCANYQNKRERKKGVLRWILILNFNLENRKRIYFPRGGKGKCCSVWKIFILVLFHKHLKKDARDQPQTQSLYYWAAHCKLHSALPFSTTPFPSFFPWQMHNKQQLQTLLARILPLRMHFNFRVVCGVWVVGLVNIELI